MIKRSFDTKYINEIINDPSIYSFVSGPITEPFDIDPILRNEKNIALMGEYGGFIFLCIDAGVYDAHSLVLPSGRGKWTIRAAKEALTWIFNHHANEVLMTVPQGNIAVRALVKILKAKFKHREEEYWWADDKKVPADIYSITKEDWNKCQS